MPDFLVVKVNNAEFLLHLRGSSHRARILFCTRMAAGAFVCSKPERYGLFWAGVAQLVEHLICNQTVGGSSPFASSRVWPGVPRRNHSKLTSWFPLAARESVCGMGWCGKALRGIGWVRPGAFYPGLRCAQVAERLMAADCKSAAPWSYGGSNPPLCTMEF